MPKINEEITDEDIANFLNAKIAENGLSEESEITIQMFEDWGGDVSEDECLKFLSECMGVSEDEMKHRFRNVKEGLNADGTDNRMSDV